MSRSPRSVFRRVSPLVLVVVAGAPLGGTAAVWAQTEGAGGSEQVDAATKALMAAHGFFERAMYREAAEEYVRFMEAHPKHEEATAARYGLALSRYYLGEYDAVAEALPAVIQDKAFARRAEALAVLAHSQMMLGQAEQAVATYDRLLKESPDADGAAGARVNRVQALATLGRYNDAEVGAEAFLKSDAAGKDAALEAAALYWAGLSRMQTGDAEAAAAHLSKLLEKYPSSPMRVDALLLWGQALEATGDLKAAAARYDEMLKAAPKERRGEALFLRGVVAIKAGDYQAGVEPLRQLLKEHPDFQSATLARVDLAIALDSTGETKEARELLTSVVKADAGEGEAAGPRDFARYWLSRIDVREGRYEEARQTLGEMLDQKEIGSPGRETVLYDYAAATGYAGDDKAAAEAWADYRRKYPESPRSGDASYLQALSLHRLGQHEEARKLAAEVANGTGYFADAARQLVAESMFQQGQYAEAGELFAKLAASIDPVNADLMAISPRHLQLRAGEAALYSGDAELAAKRLDPVTGDAAAMKEAKLREALFLHGDALLQTERFKESASLLSRYVEAVKGDEAATERREEAAYKLALAHLRAGDDAAAVKGFDGVAKGDAASPWAQRAMLEAGQLHYAAGDLDAAKAPLDRLIAAKEAPDPLTIPAAYYRAWVDSQRKDAKAAAERFLKLAKDHPEHELAGDALYQGAVALRAAGAGEASASASAWRQYLERFPKGEHAPAARAAIGSALLAGGDPKAAAATLSELAKDDKTRSAAVLYDLAWALRGSEQMDAAVAAYRDLLKSYPEAGVASPARAELGELLYGREQYEEAAKLMQAALDTKGEAAGLDDSARAATQYRLGWALLKSDQPEPAAEAWSAFAKAYPANELTPSALYQAGVASLQAKRLDAAEQAWAKLVADHAKSDLAPQAMQRLGEVRAQRGDWKGSAAAYQKALEGEPEGEDAARAHFGLGWAMENTQQYDEARKHYAAVTDATNTQLAARAQFQTGETYFKQAQWEPAARELVKTALVYGYPEWSARALYEAGQAYEQLKRPDDAKRQYREVVDKYQDHAVAKLAADRLKAMGG